MSRTAVSLSSSGIAASIDVAKGRGETSPRGEPRVASCGEVELRALSLDLRFQDVGTVGRADIEKLAGHAHRLARQLRQTIEHLDAPLNREHVVVLRADRGQNALLLQISERLGLRGFAFEHRASQAQFAAEWDRLRRKDAMFPAPDDRTG